VPRALVRTFDEMNVYLRKTIETGYRIICFFIYFSGLYRLIAFLKRNKPVILCYHSVNQQSRQDIYPDNIVRTENFERQIAYLLKKKRIVSLPQLLEYIEGTAKFPPDLVAITFDDGYYDFYSEAHPIMKKYCIPSTLFLITSLLSAGETKWEDTLSHLVNTTEAKVLDIRIGEEKKAFDLSSTGQRLDCIRDLNAILLKLSGTERSEAVSEIERQLLTSFGPLERTMLCWREVRELREDALVSFGSHTHSHCNLSGVSAETAKLEISRSKEEMERQLGRPCTLFCFPLGKKSSFNQEVKELLRAEGYSLAVTTIPGSISKRSDPFELKRIVAMDDGSYKFKCSLIGITLQKA
jgi:peptidoglycan/xylan/chitin deacetylase (PgdA/CDA1 family)